MGNEWEVVELYGANNDGCQRRYTVADGDSISAGQILSLIDARVASTAITYRQVIAGVAAEEHAPGDGTSISCYTDGIFEATASDAITIGGQFGAAADGNKNQIVALDTASGAAVMGYVLETTAAAEKVNVRLRL